MGILKMATSTIIREVVSLPTRAYVRLLASGEPVEFEIPGGPEALKQWIAEQSSRVSSEALAAAKIEAHLVTDPGLVNLAALAGASVSFDVAASAGPVEGP